MLTTTVMACKCKKLIAPAMNTQMFENPIVQDNLKKLEHYDMTVIQPDVGLLACKDVGAGKLPSEQVLMDYILREIRYEKDMAGKKVLVTAGPTVERIDPVRYISNHSTGKMGYAIARVAMERGADVTLISGPVSIAPPPFVRVVPVESAEDMFRAVQKDSEEADIIIKAAKETGAIVTAEDHNKGRCTGASADEQGTGGRETAGSDSKKPVRNARKNRKKWKEAEDYADRSIGSRRYKDGMCDRG